MSSKDPRNRIENIQRDYEWTREELIGRCRVLGERLTGIAERMDENPDYMPNTLGEVQMEGATIDVKCGRLGVLRRVLGMFEVEV